MARYERSTPALGVPILTKLSQDDLTPILSVPPHLLEKRHPCLLVISGPRIGEIVTIGERGLVIGRGSSSDLRLIDEGVSRRHAQIEVSEGQARVLDLQSTNGTWVNSVRVTVHNLTDGDKIQIGQQTVLKFAYHDPTEEAYARQLLEAALRDPLTHCFNRRYFLQRLTAEHAYATRHQSPLSLLLLDIDRFKDINDTHGHLVGDAALERVAEVLLARIRADDVLARYGGEEFALIARDISLDGGKRLAERLRAGVEQTQLRHEGKQILMAVSIGIAAIPNDTIKDAPSLIARADEALYRAKNAGRNRVSD